MCDSRPRAGRKPVSKVNQDSARTPVGPRQSPSNSVQCHNCGKFGYYARHCFRYRQDRDKNGSSRSNLQSQSQPSERKNSQRNEVV